MDERVQAYIESKSKEIRQDYEKEKTDFLIKEGLTEKEYSPVNMESKEYPNYEWVGENEPARYYKDVAIDITDEEYEMLREIYNKAAHKNGNVLVCENSIAKALFFIAMAIYAIGAIAGLLLGFQEETYGTYFTYTSTEFSLATAVTYWFIAFISGTVFLGFSEIIKLLQDIKNKK